MKNIRIGAKLLTAFVAIGFVIAVLALFSILQLSKIDSLTLLAINDRMPKALIADEMDTATSDFRIAESEHILASDDQARAIAEQKLGSRRAVIERDYQTLNGILRKPEARALLAKFKSEWDGYLIEDRRLLQYSRANQDAEAISLMRGQSQRGFDSLSDAVGKLGDFEAGLAKASGIEATSVYNAAKLMSLAAVGLALAGLGGILMLMIRLIASPLVGMTKAMGELAAGNMKAEVPVDPRADEVGDLAKAMSAFRDQLAAAERSKAAQTQLLVSSIGEGLTSLSQGDLTVRIEADLTGPFAKLKTDFNDALEALQSAMGKVSNATSGIHTGAAEIRSASDDLSQRTEQQAASLEETAAAMDEITTTVRKTAEDAGRANSAVSDARAEAEHSGEVVSRAVDAMGGIERSSAEISEIISVIDGIAFQTNLLALNAGVEAARAGDAGKGFAVVASEVRALAQRSADAAKDVKTKILASSQQVEVGVELVSETGKALERIIGRIGEISQLVSAISLSAEQQASGLAEVNTAVGEMDSVTQQNAAMVEQSTAAARSLAGEADELAEQIAAFKMDGRSSVRTLQTTVYALQQRAAPGVRQIGRPTRRNGGTAASALAEDWSEF